MNNNITGFGKIKFDPQPIKDSSGNMFKPWWVVILFEDDLGGYYRWWLEKRYKVQLQRPAWDTHISVVRGEECSSELWNKYKNLYDEHEIEFKFCTSIITNADHWWLNIKCDFLNKLRLNLGLSADAHFDFHITLGTTKPQYKEHAQYTLNNIRRFEGEQYIKN